MAYDQLNTLVRRIRYFIDIRQCRDTSDKDLLQRFVTCRDEAAFAALLHRYGPMVLGVCRRVLHDWANADDAFQATFLVLIRKAKSIRKGASVGSWLHGVAFRVAWEVKMKATEQHPPARQAMTAGEHDPSMEAARRELRFILDRELDQLPAKYRSPLVLHYLEGKTKEETARQLGWTEGTVSGRLARAREALRKRLAGRDWVHSEGMMAIMLSEQVAWTPVPKVLADATMKSASLLYAGPTASGVTASASYIVADKVMKSMFFAKLKHGFPLAMLLLLGAMGLGIASHRVWTANWRTPSPENIRTPEAILSAAPVIQAQHPKEDLEAKFGKESDAKRFAELVLSDGLNNWNPKDSRNRHQLAEEKLHAEYIQSLDIRVKDATLDPKTGDWTVTGTMNKLEVKGTNLGRVVLGPVKGFQVVGNDNWRVVAHHADGIWKKVSPEFWYEKAARYRR
jgi:RNA polymerase sigma factor (sigma-70 family)